MSLPRAIIFDIDGTLYPEVSWTALTTALGASAVAHLAIYDAYRAGAITYAASRTQLIGLWRATGHANRADFQRIFDGWEPYPGAAAAVAQVARQAIVGLITGSFDLWAATVARRLGVGHYYANTTLSWDADGQLQDYDYVLNQAGRKLEQFRDFCASQEVEPQDCVVVGDSDNDLALFRASGCGVAVGNAPAELRAAAVAHLGSVAELPGWLAAQE